MIVDGYTPAGWYPAKVVPVDDDREMAVSYVEGHGFIITAKNGEEVTRMALSPEATYAVTVALMLAMEKWGGEDFKVYSRE